MASWKKVHVEDANTVHGTITANLTDDSTSVGAGSYEVVVYGGASGSAQELKTRTFTFGSNAFNSNSYLTGNETITLSGDASGSGTTSISVSLAADSVGNDELDLVDGNSATDGYILSYDGTTGGGTLKWIAASANANDATITLNGGNGIAAIGDFTTNQSANDTLTIAVDGVLEDLVTLGAPGSDGQFIVATGAGTFAYETGDTARTSLGLGTGDSPTFAGLTVNGTTTTINSTNLLVDDTFIALNSGGSSNVDSGIVFEGAANKVFGWDQSQESGRFGVDYAGGDASAADGGFSPDAWVSTVHTASGDDDNATAALAQIGNMYIDSSNEDIYIYS